MRAPSFSQYPPLAFHDDAASHTAQHRKFRSTGGYDRTPAIPIFCRAALFGWGGDLPPRPPLRLSPRRLPPCVDDQRSVPCPAEPLRPLQLRRRHEPRAPHRARPAPLVVSPRADDPLFSAALERAPLRGSQAPSPRPARPSPSLVPLVGGGGARGPRPLPPLAHEAGRAPRHDHLCARALPHAPSRVDRQPRGAGLAGLRDPGARLARALPRRGSPPQRRD